MDFRSAVVYMKSGYRVRRSSWHPKSYMKLSIMGDIQQYHEREYWSISKEGTKHHVYIGGGDEYVNAEEILAEDWELITTGIRKEFSKHENGMEYEDDTDWDNYVSTWDYDENE